MEPFSISCTTCQARLKVRDAAAIGQILPCPKCGSMVLVEQPACPMDSGAPAQLHQATKAAPPAIVATESFDAIDQLLDDAPAETPKDDDRWRASESTAEGSGASEQVAHSTSDSIAQDEPIDAVEAAESVGESADWLSSSAIVARKYALLVGGVAIGVGAVISLAGYLLTRPAPVSQSKSAAPPPAAVSDEPGYPVETVDQPIDDGNPTDAPTRPPEPEVVESNQVEVVPDVEAPSVPQPTDPPSEPNAVATNTAEAPVQPDDPAPPQEANTLIDLGDDGLAGFARWLQDTESGPADRPKDAAPPTPDEEPPPQPVARKVSRQTRPIPDKVDVESRLKDEMIALEFNDVSLISALRTLSSFSTIPISVDPDALGRRNLTAGKQVDLLIRSTSSVNDVLRQLLEKLRLDFYVADGHLFVSTPAECEAEFVTLRHDVSDLATGGEGKVEQFGEWIQQLVAQGTWADQGGRGECRAVGSKLEITHFDTVHYQVLAFCERLRLVRGQNPITSLRPEHIEPGLRAKSLRAADTPVTLKIWRQSNLESIAAAFEQAADMQVLIDWHALHSAGWSPQDTMTFFCRHQPVEQAMTSLLEPMGLTYRVINPVTIQISTYEALEALHEIEFYPLPGNATNDDRQQISRRIVQRIGQAKFQPAGRGAIGFDTNSRSLIVSLPQHDQIVVQALLSNNVADKP